MTQKISWKEPTGIITGLLALVLSATPMIPVSYSHEKQIVRYVNHTKTVYGTTSTNYEVKQYLGKTTKLNFPEFFSMIKCCSTNRRETFDKLKDLDTLHFYDITFVSPINWISNNFDPKFAAYHKISFKLKLDLYRAEQNNR